MIRDELGKIVRDAWVAYCVENHDTNPAHLVPYKDLAEYDKEADRRIGMAVAQAVLNENFPSLAQFDFDGYVPGFSYQAQPGPLPTAPQPKRSFVIAPGMHSDKNFLLITVTDSRLLEGLSDLEFVTGTVIIEDQRVMRVWLSPLWDVAEVVAWLEVYLANRNTKLRAG